MIEHHIKKIFKASNSIKKVYPKLFIDYTVIMTRYLYFSIILLLASCGGGGGGTSSGGGPAGPNDGNPDGTNSVFTQKISQNNLAIFGRADVSSSFLANLGKAYEAMLQNTSSIDAAMKSNYNSTISSQNIYQRVGKGSPSNYSDMNAIASSPYGDNAVDYIFESGSGSDQISEVIEHLLHTITAVGFKFAFPTTWDYNNTNSQLYLAMQEAIDAGNYNITSYAALQGDAEAYRRVLTQEYAYWLILAEWDYFVTAGNVEEGYGNGNSEFKLGKPSEVITNNPLGHKLYEDYVEKILSPPNKDLIISLFP